MQVTFQWFDPPLSNCTLGFHVQQYHTDPDNPHILNELSVGIFLFRVVFTFLK